MRTYQDPSALINAPTTPKQVGGSVIAPDSGTPRDSRNRLASLVAGWKQNNKELRQQNLGKHHTELGIESHAALLDWGIG